MEFSLINENVIRIHNEIHNMTTNLKDISNENLEFKSTFGKASKEFENFKNSNNFRLSLY